MSSLIEQIDLEIERRSLLKHPFYQMWSEGKLTRDQLSGYAKEYFQLVKLVPALVENVRSKATDPRLKEDISQNLREETEHITPWIRFAASLGVEEEVLTTYEGTTATNAAVSELHSLTSKEHSFQEAVAAMYAYERELPKISRSKIDGLEKFYGLNSHDAVHYFEIHEVADVKHADLWRSILRMVSDQDEASVMSAVVKSLIAQNELLDAVMERYCAAPPKSN